MSGQIVQVGQCGHRSKKCTCPASQACAASDGQNEAATAGRVMAAMLRIGKIDRAALERAAQH